MKIISLQSGSNGNCIYVEALGTRLLFDAGISGRQARLRLAAHRRDIRDVDALLISHDHADHARCMGIYQRKFLLPVYVTPETRQAAAARCRLGWLDDVREFRPADKISFGRVRVETIPTPHDGADAVVFVVDDGRRRLGILTDLGHVFPGLDEVIGSLDAVIIESNYDPQMLADGPYPLFVKRRIRGRGGHISNVEAAELLNAAAGKRMKWACLGHLSEQNNDPDLALQTHRQILGERFPLYLAGRYEPTRVMQL
ncbi:MAG: MBL fold metallo-hydrolase [Phycisphaerae bacterium]|nr:MBL fold metallo-hydrolase [Phycisphaerae bacterium]